MIHESISAIKSKYRIALSPSETTGKEIDYIRHALENNELSLGGEQSEIFKERLQNLVGSDNMLMLSSGTAALQLALKVAGVKVGDHVLCSTFTYAATAFPISYLNATPVFIDSEPDTWNMNPDALILAIESLLKAGGNIPKAIIAVHIYGMPCRIREIVSIGEKYGIPVIEDAAESIGSHIEGQHTGTSGAFGILSFNGNKIVTTSGGGALFGADKTGIDYARKLAMQAREEGVGYIHNEIGHNFIMGNINAAVGNGQLDEMETRIARRREVYERYCNNLSELKLGFQKELPGFFSNRWMTCILMKGFAERETVRQKLGENGIESRPLWKPMHMQPVYENSLYYGEDIAQNLFLRGLAIPSGSSLSDENVDRISDIVKSAIPLSSY